MHIVYETKTSVSHFEHHLCSFVIITNVIIYHHLSLLKDIFSDYIIRFHYWKIFTFLKVIFTNVIISSAFKISIIYRLYITDDVILAVVEKRQKAWIYDSTLTKEPMLVLAWARAGKVIITRNKQNHSSWMKPLKKQLSFHVFFSFLFH